MPDVRRQLSARLREMGIGPEMARDMREEIRDLMAGKGTLIIYRNLGRKKSSLQVNMMWFYPGKTIRNFVRIRSCGQK